MKRPDRSNNQASESPPLLPLERLLAEEPAFKRFLRRRLGETAVADDLLQQSFARALQQQHTLDNQESVVPWFYRILRNAVTDYHRSRAAEARRDASFLQDLAATGADRVPAPDEEEAAACACLHRLLPVLRPAYAEVLRRVDLDNEPAAAVAKELSVTPNNLTVRLHRARQALRASLEASCGICTKHGCLNCTCEQHA